MVRGSRGDAGWSRRSLLVGAAAFGVGALSGGCLLPRDRRPRPDPTPEPFPTTQQVTEALVQLIEQVGSNRIQDLRLTPRRISATVLTDNRRTVRFTRSGDDPWDTGEEADPLEYPVSLPLDQLPLHLLPEFMAHAGPEAMSLRLSVDVTGRLRILADLRDVPRQVGIKVDGSGRVPRVDLNDPEDVAGAIAEIVEAYGSKVVLVSADDRYVHADLNIDGMRHGMRVIRYPNEAPEAVLAGSVNPESWLFDLTAADLDVALAIKLLPTIADQANLEGKAEDWQFSRPPEDSEPQLSFLVRQNEPESERVVWVDRSGKITKITRWDCAPGVGGPCPR